MANAWYLQEYKNKEYLHNKVLLFKTFPKEVPDHDHCELCWARFSNYVGDHQVGYYEKDSKSWICCDCYQELKELFGWRIKNS